jgi:hypothetical protein
MKITIWSVATDSRDMGLQTQTFGTEKEARAAFKAEVDSIWSTWSDHLHDEPDQPEDPQDAYDLLNEEIDDFSDYILLDSQEVDVPFPDYGHEIEAALCAWEWMNEKPQYEKYAELWDAFGSPGMRMASVQAGKIVLTVHDLMEAKGFDYTTAYDFQFVPGVLEQLDWNTLVDNNQYGDSSYRPDPEPILVKMMADHPEDFSDHWLETAKAEAKKQWAFPELVTEHEDSIDRTEKPADWVRRIGEKYGLSPAGSW